MAQVFREEMKILFLFLFFILLFFISVSSHGQINPSMSSPWHSEAILTERDHIVPKPERGPGCTEGKGILEETEEPKAYEMQQKKKKMQIKLKQTYKQTLSVPLELYLFGCNRICGLATKRGTVVSLGN